jgi:hypothetical protein
MNKSRFGVPEEVLLKAIKINSGLIRSGIYVPTEQEVRELDSAILRNILIEWLYECPSELIPTDEQVERVIAILKSREDTDNKLVTEMIFDCKAVLKK